MRLLFVAVVNFFVVLGWLAGLPGRALRRRRRPRYVRFRLRGSLPYRDRRAPVWRRRRAEPEDVTSLEALRCALTLLRQDPHVLGVVVEVEELSASHSKRQAIAAALAELKRAGKSVVGYAVNPTNAEYELLCAADQIFCPPAGRLDVNGYAAEALAVGGALASLGIGAQFVRRGDYKTAPELFTHTTASHIQRQTLEAFLEQRHGALVDAIASGRRMTKEAARERIDEGPFSARRAVAVGLCDGLVRMSELAEHLAKAKGTQNGAPVRLGAFQSYLASKPLRPLNARPLARPAQVGVVRLHGIIAPGDGGGLPIGPAVAGAHSVVRALRQAIKDPRSAAILLEVESPGGGAVASELIHDEVKRAAQKKPVVAFTDRVCASGGYMAALGATEIWAAPDAIVGSIGVFAGKLEFSRLLDRLGLARTVIAKGRNAAAFSSARPFSADELRSIEQSVEETYQAFLELVAAARDLTPQQVHERAEGRVYAGVRAREVGLVDTVGGFEEACARALALAGKPAARFALRVHGHRSALRLSSLSSLQGGLFALMDPWVHAPGLGLGLFSEISS